MLSVGLGAAILFLTAMSPLFALFATAAGKTAEDQDYTDTEQKFCVLAVRAEVFPGFEGEVEVVLQDGFGRIETCALTAENGYGWNLSVAEGCYQAVDVQAREGESRFEVKRLSSRLQVTEGEVTVCRLVVTDYEITEETEMPSKEGETEEHMKNQGTMEIQREEGGKKARPGRRLSLLMWLAALAAAVGYWYFRYGRRKRSGR